MPTDKFANEKKHPTDNDLRKRIGESYQMIEDAVSSIQSEYQGITFDWKFSKTSGWYLTCDRKKRRLFYLIPRDGDFTFRMVFGDKALTQITKASFQKEVVEMMRNAKKYPEGTLCEFSRRDFDPETIVRLLEVKIDN